MQATSTAGTADAGRPRARGAPWASGRALDGFILAGLALLVAALRFGAFFEPEINGDDSLFLVMGRALLMGGVPYVHFWDHHPVGGILLFAGIQSLFGESFVAARAATLLIVIAECFLLYRLGSLLGPRTRLAGLAAALIYAVYSVTNEGLAADRAFFFAPLPTLALLLLARDEAAAERHPDGSERPRVPAWPTLLAIGALLGLGVQLKYLFAWDFVAIIAVVMLKLVRASWGQWRSLVSRIVSAGLLLAAPSIVLLGAVLASFALTGHLDEWFYANVTASLRYSGGTPWIIGLAARRVIFQIRTTPLIWSAVLLAPIYLLRARIGDSRERRYLMYGLIWCLGAFAGVIFTKRLDAHYFLQALAPFSLVTGLLLAGLSRTRAGTEVKLRPGQCTAEDAPRPVSKARGMAGAAVLLIALFPTAVPLLGSNAGILVRRHVSGRPWPSSPLVEVAHYLDEHIDAGDTIYVADASLIIYHLVGLQPPTRFTNPPHLLDSWYEPIIGTSQAAVLDEIMAQAPLYIVTLAPHSIDLTNPTVRLRLDDYLQRDYHLEYAVSTFDAYNKGVVSIGVYRRNPISSHSPGGTT